MFIINYRLNLIKLGENNYDLNYKFHLLITKSIKFFCVR